MLTVAGLIEILKTHPQDMRVIVSGYEDGYDDIQPSNIRVTSIAINQNIESWVYGDHGDAQASDQSEQALLIARPNADC